MGVSGSIGVSLSSIVGRADGDDGDDIEDVRAYPSVSGVYL
jgi:hypothetical protein